MNTTGFTPFDKLISRYRLSVAFKYLKKGDIVLDLGCGVQHYLLDHGKNIFKLGYGLDYDVEDSKNGNIILKNYKFEGRLPLESRYFDKVFLLAVLEHIELANVPGLFAEFSRILKDDGSIIITTPTPRSRKLLEFIAFKLKAVAAEEVKDHKHYYVRAEILDLAQANGLRIDQYALFQFGFNSVCVLRKQT